ncbi:MAG: Hsp20/alpha crystallin family protein [Nitrospirales bacterium]
MTYAAYAPMNAQIDQLLTDAVQKLSGAVSTWVPACNAWEESDKFCIEMALPGWGSDEVSLQVEMDTLTVTGKKEPPTDSVKTQRVFSLREVETGTFVRSFRLASNIDHDQTKASFTNGILLIQFPKCENAKPRQIPIE